MARLRKPTATNRIAGVDIRGQIKQRITELHATMTAEFDSAERATDPEVSLEHQAAAHRARLAVSAAMIELAGTMLLEGVPAHTVATGSGISTATLTRNNPPYMAGLRGHDLEQDPGSPYGWRIAAS